MLRIWIQFSVNQAPDPVLYQPGSRSSSLATRIRIQFSIDPDPDKFLYQPSSRYSSLLIQIRIQFSINPDPDPVLYRPEPGSNSGFGSLSLFQLNSYRNQILSLIRFLLPKSFPAKPGLESGLNPDPQLRCQGWTLETFILLSFISVLI